MVAGQHDARGGESVTVRSRQRSGSPKSSPHGSRPPRTRLSQNIRRDADSVYHQSRTEADLHRRRQTGRRRGIAERPQSAVLSQSDTLHSVFGWQTGPVPGRQAGWTNQPNSIPSPRRVFSKNKALPFEIKVLTPCRPATLQNPAQQSSHSKLRNPAIANCSPPMFLNSQYPSRSSIKRRPTSSAQWAAVSTCSCQMMMPPHWCVCSRSVLSWRP